MRAPLMLIANLELLSRTSTRSRTRCARRVSAHGQLLIQLGTLQAAGPRELSPSHVDGLADPNPRLTSPHPGGLSRLAGSAQSLLRTSPRLADTSSSSGAAPDPGSSQSRRRYPPAASRGGAPASSARDKNANVRRAAALFSTLLEFNPFGPSLSRHNLAALREAPPPPPLRRAARRRRAGRKADAARPDAESALVAEREPGRRRLCARARAERSTRRCCSRQRAPSSARCTACSDRAPPPDVSAAADAIVTAHSFGLDGDSALTRTHTRTHTTRTHTRTHTSPHPHPHPHLARRAPLGNPHARLSKGRRSGGGPQQRRPSTCRSAAAGAASASSSSSALPSAHRPRARGLARRAHPLEEVVGSGRSKLIPRACSPSSGSSQGQESLPRRPPTPTPRRRRAPASPSAGAALALLNMAASGDAPLLTAKLDVLIAAAPGRWHSSTRKHRAPSGAGVDVSLVRQPSHSSAAYRVAAAAAPPSSRWSRPSARRRAILRDAAAARAGRGRTPQHRTPRRTVCVQRRPRVVVHVRCMQWAAASRASSTRPRARRGLALPAALHDRHVAIKVQVHIEECGWASPRAGGADSMWTPQAGGARRVWRACRGAAEVPARGPLTRTSPRPARRPRRPTTC